MSEPQSEAANIRHAFAQRSSATDPLPRIDTLIRTARTNWFGLMAYLAFVGVTLMGVEDADFFLIERQTELPLIGVSVPTSLFFYIAPLLGALLHVHLHLYLLRLWKALKDAGDTLAGQPLAEATSPWLVVDMALSHRKDAQHPYPLRRVAWFAALILVFISSPSVLGFFWWHRCRNMTCC